MTTQTLSTVRGAERLRTAVTRRLFFLCVLASPLCVLADHRGPENKQSSKPNDGYRFEITDAESNVPVSSAVVSVAYWQTKGTGEVRKEIEVKTDKTGLAEFPRIEADKLMVSVTSSGYRSYWRWIRTDSSQRTTRIGLEKWSKRTRTR
jgi:hypothetical protein